MNRLLTAFAALFIALPSLALGQSAPLQGGPWTSGHAPMYSSPGFGPPVIQDSGTAAGGASGVGLSELGLTVRGAGITPPYSNAGTGPLATNICDYDAPITNATGYHYLCFSPNAQGGGLIAYGASGGATALPLQFNINGALAFSGTKTAGSCTFTIVGGIITAVTGC